MKLKFTVTGMTCAACSARVEKVTKAVPGVKSAEVNLLAGSMQVETDNPEVAKDIIRAVQDAGYNAVLPGKQEKKEEREEVKRQKAEQKAEAKRQKSAEKDKDGKKTAKRTSKKEA